MRSRPGAASRGTPSASLKAEQKSLEASVRAGICKREAQGVLAGVKRTPRRKARSVRRNGRPAHHRASGGPLRMRAGMNGTGCLHQPRVGRPLGMVVPGMRRDLGGALGNLADLTRARHSHGRGIALQGLRLAHRISSSDDLAPRVAQLRSCAGASARVRWFSRGLA